MVPARWSPGLPAVSLASWGKSKTPAGGALTLGPSVGAMQAPGRGASGGVSSDCCCAVPLPPTQPGPVEGDQGRVWVERLNSRLAPRPPKATKASQQPGPRGQSVAGTRLHLLCPVLCVPSWGSTTRAPSGPCILSCLCLQRDDVSTGSHLARKQDQVPHGAGWAKSARAPVQGGGKHSPARPVSLGSRCGAWRETAGAAWGGRVLVPMVQHKTFSLTSFGILWSVHSGSEPQPHSLPHTPL